MEMGMDGLLPLQSAGDVRCLLKERHGGAAGGWRCTSVVLVQQLDLANLVLKERWLSAHRRDNSVRNGSCRVDLTGRRSLPVFPGTS